MSWMTLGLAVFAWAFALTAGAPAFAAPTRTPVVLNAPASVRATALSSMLIQVDWTDTNTKEAGYSVERGASASGPFSEVAKLRRNKTSFTDAPLTANTTYFYRVRARGKRNVFSPYSPVASGKTLGSATDRTRPTVPVGIQTTTMSCSQIDVRWGSSTDAGGSGLRGYKLFRNGAFVKEIAAPATSTSDVSLAPSTAYSYTVSAIDNAGNESVPSTAGTGTTFTCPSPSTVVRRFGGSGHDIASRNTVAPDGSEVIVGSFTGTADFGGTTLTTTGLADGDAFVAKYAPDGSLAWAKQLGSPTGRGDSAKDVAIDGQGNVVVVGQFMDTVNFGGGNLTSAGGWDIFVAKFTAGGAHVWSKRFGAAGDDLGDAIAVDASDNIMIGGGFIETVSFGGAPLVSTKVTTWTSMMDPFVASFTPAGVHRWSKSFATGNGMVLGLAVDRGGDVALDWLRRRGHRPRRRKRLAVRRSSGVCRPALGNGRAPLVVCVRHRLQRRLRPQRRVRPRRQRGACRRDRRTGQRRWSGIAGRRRGQGFIAKYAAASGAHMWSRTVGGWGSMDAAHGVAVDSADAVVVTGYFSGTTKPDWGMNFGGPPLTSSGERDAFVAKYTSQGAHVWSKRFGGADADIGWSVAIDANWRGARGRQLHRTRRIRRPCVDQRMGHRRIRAEARAVALPSRCRSWRCAPGRWAPPRAAHDTCAADPRLSPG